MVTCSCYTDCTCPLSNSDASFHLMILGFLQSNHALHRYVATWTISHLQSPRLNLCIITAVRILLFFFLASWLSPLLDQLIEKDPTENQNCFWNWDQYCLLGQKKIMDHLQLLFFPLISGYYQTGWGWWDPARPEVTFGYLASGESQSLMVWHWSYFIKKAARK